MPVQTPPITSYASAQRCVTFTTLAVVNAIVTSLATSATPSALTGAALNGALAGGPYTGSAAGSMPVQRSVTVTTATHAGSYKTGAGNAITVKGTDANGSQIQDVLVLTQSGGNETVSTSLGFATVTEIDIPAQNDALGSFQFGVRDVVMSFRRVRNGGAAAGDIHIQNFVDPTQDVIPSVQVGETLNVAGARLYGDALTTATKITLEQ